MTRSLYVLRDDKPEPECNCAPLIADHHATYCATKRERGGAFYYAGQDLEGHWFIPGVENAARFAYRDAQRLRRELSDPRLLLIERVAPEPENSQARPSS